MYTRLQKNSEDATIRKGTDTFIPLDLNNIDYQEYLEWEAIEGNDAEVIDLEV